MASSFSSAVAAAQHQRHRVAIAFDTGADAMPFALQRQEIGPEALHQRQVTVETVRQTKTRFGAEEQDTAAGCRHRQHAASNG